MTVRNVAIRLTADTAAFTAKMRAAGVVASETFNKANAVALKQKQAITDIGTTAGKASLVMGAAVGAAVFAAANFDSAMSKVAAATHESASNMDALRVAALKAGKDTVFSATEAADAVTALAKAGVSTGDILGGGLNGALSLASAGELDVATAADIAATAMNQFGLQGADIPHIADLLAAAAGKAQGEVTDMANAFKFVGPVAHQMGISIEETTGTIALLAKQGIVGEQAGTSLRGMLTALTSPSKLAATEMKNLGINMYDASGAFIGLDGVAGQLQSKMSGLTNAERDQALGRIFGNEQITAARILYEGGSEAVDKWTKAVDDQGFAAETAALKMDNLKGDLEQLKGSLETALIGTGEGAQGPLRELVQLLTAVTNAYISLPGPVKNGGLAVGAFLAVVGAAAFVASRMITGLNGIRTNLLTVKTAAAEAGLALKGMNKSGLAIRGAAGLAGLALSMGNLGDQTTDTGRALSAFSGIAGGALIGFSVGGPWGAAIGGAAGLLGAFAQKNAAAAAQVDALTGTLDEQTGAITENSFEWAANELAKRNLVDDTRELGLSAGEVTTAMLNQGDAADELTTKLQGIIEAHTEYRSAGRGTAAVQDDMANSAQSLLDIIGDTNGTLGDARDKFNFTKDAAAAAADATDGFAGAADGAADATFDLSDALNELNGILDKRAGLRDYQQSLLDAKDIFEKRRDVVKQLADAQSDLANADTKSEKSAALQRVQDLKAQLKDMTLTLRGNSQAALDNNAALDRVASSALGAANNAKSFKEAKGILTGAQDQIASLAVKFGLSREAARHLAERLVDVDAFVKQHREFNLDTRAASGKISEFEAALKKIPRRIRVKLEATGELATVGRHQGVALPGYDEGGFTGAGGRLEPAGIVHRGEFVTSAEKTARYRPVLDAIHQGRSLPGYANGGFVGVPFGGGSFDLGSKFDRLASRVEMLAARGNGVHFSGDMHVNNGRDLLTRADASRQQAAGV